MRVLAIIVMLFMLPTPSLWAAGVENLATCATKVLSEIGRSHKWSGRAPAGCPEGLAVTKQADGVLVTAWSVTDTRDGWQQTSFSAGASYEELSQARVLTVANRDIMERARRLERCLRAFKAGEAQPGCRSRAVKEYIASEETGVKDTVRIELDDTDRYTAVEYTEGDTIATPTPPDDADEGDALPPGLQIKVFTAPPR